MLKRLLAASTLLFAVALSATSAPAQTPAAGDKGRFAAGLQGGATFPFGAGYDIGWTAGASFDYYASRLFAVRATADYASSSTDLTDEFTRSSFLVSAVFQFDRGALRPYARAGVGVYGVSPPVGATRVRVGVHAGGGLEWFFGSRTSLAGDVVVHLLPDAEDRSTSGLDATIGIRQYF